MATPAPQSADVQAALDAAPCGLLRTDEDGLILNVNRTFCDWVHWTAQELCSRRLQDLLTMGGRIFHQTHWMPLLQMQGSLAEVKVDLVPRTGAPLPVVLNARRHVVDGQTVDDLAIFMARERDAYERELVQSRKRLELLVEQAKTLQDEAKDRALVAEQMMGIVSHDLRNPLQTIQMGVLLLTRGDVTPHQLGVLGRISRAADRSHRLIADLLDFTQARLGKGLSMHKKPFALHTTLAEVVEELAQAFGGRKLLHERNGEGECIADPDRIAQLVGNLVSNAMSYGDANAPVTVRSQIGKSEFSVSVHNMGKPIAPGDQATLFMPLVRGVHDGSASRSVGLGLFIVNEIAKAHGGRMAVHSTAAEGTTFTATLPCGRQ